MSEIVAIAVLEANFAACDRNNNKRQSEHYCAAVEIKL
jgi:hypothetical protein